MGSVKFGAGEQPVAAEAPKANPAETSAPASQALATRQSFIVADYIPTLADIKFPRLSIVHPLSATAGTFHVGSLLFDARLSLFVPPDINPDNGEVRRAASKPATITVLGFRPTRYVEKVKFGDEARIVNSPEEVAKAGGTLDYKEWELKKDSSGMVLFQTLADAVIAIEKPEHVADDDSVFIFPVDGKKYAVALWALKGSAYTELAKGVFFAAKQLGVLRSGYPTHSFYVSTKLKPKGKNKVWCPYAIPAIKSTPAFLDFANNVIGGSMEIPPATGAAEDSE